MTRFKLPTPSASEVLQTATSLSSHLFGNAGATASPDFACSIYLPVHFEIAYSYPLVVWLPDEPDDHRSLTEVMTAISDRNYVGASIGGNGLLSGGKVGWRQTPHAIEEVANRACEVLDQATRRFNINHRRVFIAGAGQGGTMALRLAFRRPDLFCGVGSFDGPLPRQFNPLGNVRQCRSVPVYLAHSRNSQTLPEGLLCRELKMLHLAGFNVTLRQYPCEVLLPDQPFSDFDTWIMEQLADQPDSGIVL